MGGGQAVAGYVTDMQTPSPEHPAPHPWVPPRSPVCPIARSLPVGDAALNTFEQRVQGANLTEDHIWFFPKYGFCDTADQFHILDEARR